MATQTRNWWDLRSAADDSEIDDGFEYDDDDFDFEDDRDDSIGGFWNRYSTQTTDDRRRIVDAQRLCQGLVDTFATGEKPYRVSFVEHGVGATDYGARTVTISHKPLLDRTITPELGQAVVTAVAAHEAAHVRYGGRTIKAAVQSAFGYDARAHVLSNIVKDVHDEAGFVADYPGFRGLFAPAIRYVAESDLAKSGLDRYPAIEKNPIDVAVAAARYAEFTDWAGMESELAFWSDWAARAAKGNRAADHVAFVREGLAHLAEQERAAAERKQDERAETESSDETGDDGRGDESGETSGDESFDAEQAARQDRPTLDPCWADAAEDVAEDHGVDNSITGEDADQLVTDETSRVSAQSPLGGDISGEAHWNPRAVITGRPEAVAFDGSVSGAIRAAFARTRTGHFETTRNLKSGRLDNRSLVRVASNDYRLFNKRTAPSEGKYLIWLLVDCSGSMFDRTGWNKTNDPIHQATRLSAALATATRFLPNIRLDVWGWTTAIKLSGASFAAVRVWSTGEPVANTGYLPKVNPGHHTPDGETLIWAAKAIRAAAKPDETPLIIIASDGHGSLRSSGHGSETVDAVRRSGVGVVSVALGELGEDNQRSLFGEGNFISWPGSIRALARPLGDLVARMAAGRK